MAGRPFDGERQMAEAIDALYRESAAPRDHERLIDLLTVQLRRVHLAGYRAGKDAAGRAMP